VELNYHVLAYCPTNASAAFYDNWETSLLEVGANVEKDVPMTAPGGQYGAASIGAFQSGDVFGPFFKSTDSTNYWKIAASVEVILNP
jgi:hypothetical protein